MRQLINNGIVNTRDMNIPLLSKYCCFENNLEKKHNINPTYCFEHIKNLYD